MQRSTSIACTAMQNIALACMNHDARCTKLTVIHCTVHNYTTYTSDTIDQQHKIMQKTESHEFPEFLLEKFWNFGTWGKMEFPEIRKSEFPELQSLASCNTEAQ
jgi:hypothetical protein